MACSRRLSLPLKKGFWAFIFTTLAFAVVCTSAGADNENTVSTSPNQNTYGFVEVRKDAEMFWWLYEKSRPDPSGLAPLLIYLPPGMPGASASGQGNFGEAGPLGESAGTLSRRTFAGWTERANVLFVDSPIGSGFSFARNEEALPKTDEEVVDDLVQLIQGVLQDSEASYILTNGGNAQETGSPLRVFVYGESYGARYATLLGERLARTDALVPIRFGDAEVSPQFEGLVLSSPILDMELALKSWPTALEKRLSSSLSSSDVEDLDRLRTVGGMSQEWVEQHDVKFALELFEVGESIARAVYDRHTHDILGDDSTGNDGGSAAAKMHSRKLAGVSSTRKLLENHHMAEGPLAGFLEAAYSPSLRAIMSLFESSATLNELVQGNRPAWGDQAAQVYKSMMPSMFDAEANRAATVAFGSLAKAHFPITILVGKQDFIGGREHVQMLLQTAAARGPVREDDILADLDFQPMPFRIRHRRASGTSFEYARQMKGLAAHLAATQSSAEATDVDYSTVGDIKGEMYTSGSVSVYEVEDAAHFTVADDSATTKELANTAMGVTSAATSGTAVGLLCDDGISNVAYIQTVQIIPAPCCALSSISVNVISSGGISFEQVTFTDDSFHRMTVTNTVSGATKIIQKPVTSGAAPDFCGAFTAACDREDFCDWFLPTVTFWGFRTGCTMNIMENVSLEYRVSSRATQGAAGRINIKYEVWVTDSKRLMCSFAQDL